jgi:hypothetical protein
VNGCKGGRKELEKAGEVSIKNLEARRRRQER